MDIKESHAELLAACKIAAGEIKTKVFVAGCVDDDVSPELKRLWGIRDKLDTAIKNAEKISVI